MISNRVLKSIDAHGGLERWHAVNEIVISASVGGASLSVKHQGKAIRNLQGHISPARQHVMFVPYPEPGRRGVFEGGAVRIESDRGEIIAERSDARHAFRGFRHQLWWDKLDVLYFCGYALWTYLTIPFILAEPGFEAGSSSHGRKTARPGRGLVSASHPRFTHTVASRPCTSMTRASCAGTTTHPRCSGSGPRQRTTPSTIRPSTGWSCPRGEGCSFAAGTIAR
jgi:hypothetical protein